VSIATYHLLTSDISFLLVRLKFGAVKALAISFLLELENQGKITRSDGFQGVLNAIAGDVRSKHRKRLQRQQEMENMNDALRHLAERKKYFEEQINSYHNYVETAMNTMQRGKGCADVIWLLIASFYLPTGKSALYSHSPSNTFTFAICRSLAKPRSLARSYTQPSISTTRGSCCPSTSILLGSLTKSN